MVRITVTAALVVLSYLAAAPGEVAAQSQPDDQLTIAFDVSIAPRWFDPADTEGIGTPFVFLYALHDALIKPLPGNDMAPCLAESWKESACTSSSCAKACAFTTATPSPPRTSSSASIATGGRQPSCCTSG